MSEYVLELSGSLEEIWTPAMGRHSSSKFCASFSLLVFSRLVMVDPKLRVSSAALKKGFGSVTQIE